LFFIFEGAKVNGMDDDFDKHGEETSGDADGGGDGDLENIINMDDLRELGDLMKQSQDAPPEPKAATVTKSNAVVLYELCLDSGVTVFRDAEVSSILARFPVAGRHVICGLKDSRFVAWATRKFFLAQLIEPKKNDIEGASRLLEALAWEQPPIKIHSRVAEDGGAIYLDLANDGHELVRIDPGGWKVTNDGPWFRRSQTGLALPHPERGGNLLTLRKFVNLPENDFIILTGWLVAAFNLQGACPILSVSSEFGSGKSTLLRLIEGLVDPNVDTELSLFKDEDSMISTSCCRYVVPYGNLSSISNEKSDALCRLSTGGGLSKRKLFSDNDNFSASVKRPVILNGIELNLSRLDLLSRAFTVSLNPIIDYKDEAEIFGEFEKERPKILGALCDAASAALREKTYSPKVQNRLVDAIRFILRSERRGGLPWAVGTFGDAFDRMEMSKRSEALERDSAAQTILALSDGGGWHGTIKDLLGEVLRGSGSPEERRFLPGTAHAMGRKLTELTPLLRLEGVAIERSNRGGRYSVKITKNKPSARDGGGN
jgi:hypothetical protein